MSDRANVDAISSVLHAGRKRGTLDATKTCSPPAAQRRFPEWTEAGVFHELWRRGLPARDEVAGVERDWLTPDGATGKGP